MADSGLGSCLPSSQLALCPAVAAILVSSKLEAGFQIGSGVKHPSFIMCLLRVHFSICH